MPRRRNAQLHVQPIALEPLLPINAIRFLSILFVILARLITDLPFEIALIAPSACFAFRGLALPLCQLNLDHSRGLTEIVQDLFVFMGCCRRFEFTWFMLLNFCAILTGMPDFVEFTLILFMSVMLTSSMIADHFMEILEY